jgi:hypothetical protein
MSRDFTFDSSFESGNLDLVIQSSEFDFNAYLRSDTNTKGYCNWFFFRFSRVSKQAASYRFNILNMYKRKTLYRH